MHSSKRFTTRSGISWGGLRGALTRMDRGGACPPIRVLGWVIHTYTYAHKFCSPISGVSHGRCITKIDQQATLAGIANPAKHASDKCHRPRDVVVVAVVVVACVCVCVCGARVCVRVCSPHFSLCVCVAGSVVPVVARLPGCLLLLHETTTNGCIRPSSSSSSSTTTTKVVVATTTTTTATGL